MIKIGVFGAWRGHAYINVIKEMSDCCVTAVCDKDIEVLNRVKVDCPKDVKLFQDPEDFLNCEMDAVILCNYFHEHAAYAIKAMEMGMHVLSETTSAVTLKECVDLVRAVEKTGRTYMLAENYPYMRACQELERLYKGGTLGKVIYGEGEYVHPSSLEEFKLITPTIDHWRSYIPRTYYLTHSLGPLMKMTDTMPKAVNAKTIHSDMLEEQLIKTGIRKVADCASIMLVEMDNGALFRVTGSADYAPSGNWYRLACEHGGAENVRGKDEMVRIEYNSWSKPENAELSRTYLPEWSSNKELAEKAGHGGGDFWVVYEFIKALKEGTTPYFDVYKGVAMSATGILGWRSSLENGKEYRIPDFRNPDERKLVEMDDLSPFPNKNGVASLPCSTKYR